MSAGIQTAQKARLQPGLSIRGLIIGQLGVVGAVYTTIWIWAIWPGQGFTYLIIYVNVVLLLLLMTYANARLAARFPKLALRQTDLVVAWSMMTIATGLCHLEGLQILPHLMVYPFTPATLARHSVQAPLPSWLMVQDPEAIRGFFLGQQTLYTWPVLRAWLGPVLWWTLFLTALTGVMIGLNVLFRRRWVEEQKLDFPLVRLPLAMTQPGAALYRNRLFWTGCGIGGGLLLSNTISQYVPLWPTIPTDIDLSGLCQTPPWTGIKHPSVSFHPLVVGVVYLMPNEMLISLVVFALWWNFQSVFAVASGWTATPFNGFPYFVEQSLGAYLGLGLMIFWVDRGYLTKILSSALLRPMDGEREDTIEIRRSLLLIGISLLFLFWFCRRVGLEYWTIACFLFLYYSLSMAITKIRIQVGPPGHDLGGLGPSRLLPSLVGSGSFSQGSLAGMAVLSWFNLSGFGNPMPPQAEGLKLASETGGLRLVPAALLLTTTITVLSFFWIYLHVAYSHGASYLRLSTLRDLVASQQYGALDGWLQQRRGVEIPRLGAIGFGLAAVSLIAGLRMYLPGFFLHPVAYPLAFSGLIDGVLPALFGVWLIKSLLIKTQGLRLLQPSFAVAYGLIVGFSVVWVTYFLIGGLVGL